MEMARLLVWVVTFLACMLVAQAADSTTAYVKPNYPIKWIKIHGWLMWISMGLLMPVAIILVRFSKSARERGDLKTVRTLVYIHIGIQAVAVVTSIVSASIAVNKFDNKFGYIHERLGLALWILVWFAPLIGLIRPDHGVRSRPIWYAAHWLAGTGGVLLGFYNIYTGITALEYMSGKNLRTFSILFSIEISFVAFIYLTQDRWQYFREQGLFSKTVTPEYNDHRPKDFGEPEGHHHVQIIPTA